MCLAAGKVKERRDKEEREERKEIKAKPKIKDFIYKNKNLQKILQMQEKLYRLMLGFTKQEGLYIGNLKA